jgi:tRNA1(Val) A37 N6-methylase TrmN6
MFHSLLITLSFQLTPAFSFKFFHIKKTLKNQADHNTKLEAMNHSVEMIHQEVVKLSKSSTTSGKSSAAMPPACGASSQKGNE